MLAKTSPFVLRRSVPVHTIIKPIDFNYCKRKIGKMFSHSLDLRYRQIGDEFLITYLFTVTDFDRLERTVIAPLQRYVQEKQMGFNTEKQEQDPSNVFQRVFSSAIIETNNNWNEIARKMIRGICVIFQKDTKKAMMVMLPVFERRQVMEPEGEKIVRGPREGFIEDITINIQLLRRKLRTPTLVFEQMTLGSLSETRIALAYVKGICDPDILQEVKERLQKVNAQSILDTGYIEEYVIDHPLTPMPQAENTEKPDKVIAEILEGRVAILVDGTPNVIIVPTIFTQFIQASEDAYETFWYGTALRIIRMFAMFCALFLSGLWVAITTMHAEMLPTTLVLTLAGAREGVPFPAVLETFIMEVAFELIREAGLRLPAQIGPAVSIVGALIIGQAAVEAGLVSPALVVIVALAGVSSFTMPSYRLAIGLRLMRFVVLFSGAMLGLVGISLITILFLVHLASMQSYGIPYFQPLAPIKYRQMRDYAYRQNWREKHKKPFNIGLNRMEYRQGDENPSVAKQGTYKKP